MQKSRKREVVTDWHMGPKEPHSSVLSIAQGADEGAITFQLSRTVKTRISCKIL